MSTSDNEILAASARNGYVRSVVWQEFSAKKHIKEVHVSDHYCKCKKESRGDQS